MKTKREAKQNTQKYSIMLCVYVCITLEVGDVCVKVLDGCQLCGNMSNDSTLTTFTWMRVLHFYSKGQESTSDEQNPK